MCPSIPSLQFLCHTCEFSLVIFSHRYLDSDCINFRTFVFLASSVASFLILGGQDPQMYRQKKKCMCNLYARASEASERLRNVCIFNISKYICIHIQPMQWYGTINDSLTDKTLTLRKTYEYASERA